MGDFLDLRISAAVPSNQSTKCGASNDQYIYSDAKVQLILVDEEKTAKHKRYNAANGKYDG